MNKNFTFAQLSENQIIFLNEYCPKDRHITSTKEMKEIISTLGLDEHTDVEEIRSIRNSVVSLYSKLSKNAAKLDENDEICGLTDESMNYHTAMMSVTAVIDHVMYNINKESV